MGNPSKIARAALFAIAMSLPCFALAQDSVESTEEAIDLIVERFGEDNVRIERTEMPVESFYALPLGEDTGSPFSGRSSGAGALAGSTVSRGGLDTESLDDQREESMGRLPRVRQVVELVTVIIGGVVGLIEIIEKLPELFREESVCVEGIRNMKLVADGGSEPFEINCHLQHQHRIGIEGGR